MSRKPASTLAGMAVAMLCWASSAQATGAVVLDEVNCEGTDWVELVNTADSPADIGGWLLTDDPLDADPPRAEHRFTFPAPTAIGAHDSLVVEKVAGGFPFGISCGNDTVRLADASGAPADSVEVPDFEPGSDTWGRYPSGTGAWTQTSPTKGSPNLPSTASPPGDAAGWLFDPASVVEIDLSIPDESRAALDDDPDEYQDATFSLSAPGGTYGPLAVGVRLKGNTSFRTLSGKAAFKISFPHSVPGQRFLGLKRLTLNNMVQDASMLHELLAYELFRAAGIAAPRTGYAYVRVDGADYGLYLDVETPDEFLLRRWFATTKHLYEGNAGADVTPDRVDRFEADEGNDDRSDLEALVAAANAQGDFSDRMAPVADLEEMTRMWAVEKYIGHWDGYSSRLGNQPNNFFLHSDSAGRFRMLPWGTDNTFTERVPFVGQQGVLFAGCLADPSCAAAFRGEAMAVPAIAAGLDLDGLVTRTAATLAPWQALDPRREQSLAEIADAVTSTRAFIAARPGDLDDPLLWGERPRVVPTGPPDQLDLTPPETTIVDGPDPVLRGSGRGRRVRVAFESEPGARFECRLDDGAFDSCDSPVRIRAGRGPHRFRVRAIDGSGNADPSPAIAAWRVARR